MKISEYLDNFTPDTLISIIGPLYRSGPMQEPLLFVDGGSNCRVGNAGLSVGDGDSSVCPMDIPLPTDKDYSDLAFALKSIPANYSSVCLYGFLGKRRDHEYFNLGAAHQFLESRSQPSTIRFEQTIIGYTAGTWSFHREGLFSILSLKDAWLTLHGDCRYQCRDRTRFRALDSLGLSNVGHGEIHLQTENPVFVIHENTFDSR
ncbi:MAG: hypothetical protein OXF73_01840 [Gammaproteobacteria bacterium]|nr:hypothetical protein [Gammaproteobacteria bacterium]MCY4228751.1 hypothetical protein [Gammaproteobacteria bacterium]